MKNSLRVVENETLLNRLMWMPQNGSFIRIRWYFHIKMRTKNVSEGKHVSIWIPPAFNRSYVVYICAKWLSIERLQFTV